MHQPSQPGFPGSRAKGRILRNFFEFTDILQVWGTPYISQEKNHTQLISPVCKCTGRCGFAKVFLLKGVSLILFFFQYFLYILIFPLPKVSSVQWKENPSTAKLFNSSLTWFHLGKKQPGKKESKRIFLLLWSTGTELPWC